MGLGLRQRPCAVSRAIVDDAASRSASETAMTSVNISELAATARSAVVPSRETQAVSTTDSSGSAACQQRRAAIALIFASSSLLPAATAVAAIDDAASAASSDAALRRVAGAGRMQASAAVCDARLQ